MKSLLLPMFLASFALAAQPPRIATVVPLSPQPHAGDAATIWYDDFDGPRPEPYFERQGDLSPDHSFGGPGKSLLQFYAKGSRGKGDRKVMFGDFPTGDKVPRKGERFDELYWRVYVRHQPGWVGGGEAKLSRATSITSPKWTQAMIAHVWSGPGDSLTLDPATGVRNGQVVTTRYNDFANLKWLGNRPASQFAFSSPDESGWWKCVESYAKLNTPGRKDGVNRLWIDGRLECERTDLDFRGTYDKHGINAVFLEAYWNDGSPADQSRWLDLFIISTKPIGPVVAPRTPTLIKADPPAPWQVELLVDDEPAWKSPTLPGTTKQATVDRPLPAGVTVHCKVRHQVDGQWSDWSRPHQAFVTGRAE